MSRRHSHCFLCQKKIEDLFIEIPMYDANTNCLVGSIDICINCLSNLQREDSEDKSKGVNYCD